MFQNWSIYTIVSSHSVFSLLNQRLQFFRYFFYLFIWLCWVLVAACRLFSCNIWDLVPWPRIEPGPPALGAQSLSHWTTTEVPIISKLYVRWQYFIHLSTYWITVPATELDRKEREVNKISPLTLMISGSNRKGNHTCKQTTTATTITVLWELRGGSQ